MLKTRQTCRICGSKLVDVLDLGEMHLAGYLSKDDSPINRKTPMCLTRCDVHSSENACGLVQLKHTTSPNLLYAQYYYRSGINKTMTNHLGDIAKNMIKYSNPAKDDIIIDIGCNDGTLLNYYANDGYTNLYGFDPSNMSEFSKNVPNATIIEDYFSYGAFAKIDDKSQAKCITSIAMFYDLENPHDFVRSIESLLSHNGIWVLEQSYLPLMLIQNSFDTICHEHLEYYSLATLEFLFSKHNLQIFDIYTNDTNGGSAQIYVCHHGAKQITKEAKKRINDLRKWEFELKLDTPEPYNNFANRVKENCKNLVDFIKSEVKKGKKVFAYGASTKGNTTLQYCKLDNTLIEYCAERNEKKYGLEMIGTGIPIISEKKARQLKPDYFLLLPWHFLEEFKEREKDFFNRGGKFILPMPEFKIFP